jgi:two-component system, NtrC family, sensor kinase
MDQKQNFSNLVLWGEPLQISSNFELIQHQDLNQVLPYIIEGQAKVLIVNLQKIELIDLNTLFMALEKQSQKTEVIAVLNSQNHVLNNSLISMLNPSTLFYQHDILSENQSIQNIEKSILAAIRKYDYHRQNLNFYLLFQEQSEKLQELNTELEERIKIKNTSLKRSQSRLLLIRDQLNLMYECILGIQNAKTIAEIEDFLTEKLSDYFQISWIRALVGQKEVYSETFIIEGQKKFKIFGTPLYFGKRSIGHIYFAKLEPDFKKKDEAFFLQLSEIVSIKINQIIHYSDLLITRSQWQQTFKAIKHQVTIVDGNFNILNSNLTPEPNKKKCYQLLFNKEHPCEGCQLGKRFELQQNAEWLKVTSQKMKSSDQKTDQFINIYQNFTEQKNIEVKILEKTKLSDLGILAGSLAHELNNPLAGIITFLQLILSDPQNTPQDALTDIQDLLNAALDCKSVIQSILESVRNNQSLDLELK